MRHLALLAVLAAPPIGSSRPIHVDEEADVAPESQGPRPSRIRVCPSTGDDSHLLARLLAGQAAATGTIELATLAAAQSAARVLRQQHSDDDPERVIEVVLCPEAHALRSPLRFTGRDHHQVWRGERPALAPLGELQAPTLSAAVHLPPDGWAKVAGNEAGAFESPFPAGVAPFRHLWRSGDGIRLKRATLEGVNGTCGGFDACAPTDIASCISGSLPRRPDRRLIAGCLFVCRCSRLSQLRMQRREHDAGVAGARRR